MILYINGFIGPCSLPAVSLTDAAKGLTLEPFLDQMGASVITPAYPGRWKKGQNDGNPCAYSEKPTSHRKFLGFPIFYRDFLYFLIFCYIFLGFPINGHPHWFLGLIRYLKKQGKKREGETGLLETVQED